MNSLKLSKLMKKYATCPVCGSTKVNTKDAIRIGTDSFTRNCECGFTITVDEDDREN